MPRRINDLESPPALQKKKAKVIEECSSLDVSFFDDEALPPGIIFTDVKLKKWRIGKPIGRGSFGRIYLASDDVENEVTKQNARYVVKIEPHTNGPLFVEIHCMIRTAQVSKVNAWRQQNKLKRIGMPLFIANGSFIDDNSGTKYRFLVLPRYDIDLQKIIARTKILDLKNVLILSLQILDVLEYLHSHGYTHSDIKSSNLVLGFDGNKFVKATPSKQTTSFQKESKQVILLPGKHRKPKTGRSRPSNYYDDQDFTVSLKNTQGEGTVNEDHRIANVKRKLRKILTDKDYRTLHRNHSFNLRQLSNYVNYEDLGSACSDKSYQKLLDDFGNKTLMSVADKFNNDAVTVEMNDLEINMDLIYREAILSQSNEQIYLLDYGLATKFLDSEGNHKDFVMDARKAHDGTLEYSSRDSHIGAHSRRSDLETLGYNMLDWLTGTLPWKTKEVLAEPDLVHALKKNFMSDVKTLIKTCFKTEFYPQVMEKYLQYITSLDYTEKPDYDYCRNLFRSELIKNGFIFDREITLNFAEPLLSPVCRNKMCYSKRFGRKNTPPDFLARNGIKKTSQRENVCSLENDLQLELLKQTLSTSRDGMRKPCASRNFFISDAELIERLKKSLMPHDIFGKKLSPKNLRSKKRNISKFKGTKRYNNNLGKFGNFMGSARQFTWAEILAGNPEDIIRKERQNINNEYEDKSDDGECKYKMRKLSNASNESCNDANVHSSPLMHKDYLHNLNPTYAMKEVLANLKKKVTGKVMKEQEDCPPGLEGYTPAMIKLYKSKEKREAREKLDMQKQNLEQKELKRQPRCTRSISGFVVENNTPPKLIKKKNTDNSNVNTSAIDSHTIPSSTETNNQTRSLKAKSFTNKKKIADNLMNNDDKTPETDSCIATITSENCDQIRTRRVRNVADKKYSEDFVIYNVKKTPETNTCAVSKPCDPLRIRRAKSVANKKNMGDNSVFSYENNQGTKSCLSSNTCDQIKTRRAKSNANKKNYEKILTLNEKTTLKTNFCVDFKTCDQIKLRRAKSAVNVKEIKEDSSAKLRRGRSSVHLRYNKLVNNDPNEILNKSSDISSAAVNSKDPIRILRTRTIACKMEQKNAITVSKTLPRCTETNRQIRTCRCTEVAVKNSDITNVKCLDTEPYLECPASTNKYQLKKCGKSVTYKKEVKIDTAINNDMLKMPQDVGAASTKSDDYVPTRITRSVTDRKKKSAPGRTKKLTTPRTHKTRVLPKRRGLRSSKRKKS